MITVIGCIYLCFLARLLFKCTTTEGVFEVLGTFGILYFVLLVPLGAPIW